MNNYEPKYDFALDVETGEIVSIFEAKSNKIYNYPIHDKVIKLNNCFNGKKIKPYWRAETNEFSKDQIFHNNCIMKLALDKYFTIKHNHSFEIVKAHYVLTDKNHMTKKFIQKAYPEFNMVPDVIFLDENNKFICIVEVYNTHAKSLKDIEIYKKYNLTAFEIKYENDYKQKDIIELVTSGDTEKIRGRIKGSSISELEDRIQKTNNEIVRIKQEIREVNESISRNEFELNRKHQPEIIKCNNDCESLRGKIVEIENEIETTIREIRENESTINIKNSRIKYFKRRGD